MADFFPPSFRDHAHLDAVEAVDVSDVLLKYDRHADGRTVVEDTKGMRTDVYRIKRKLMLWVHGIVITER